MREAKESLLRYKLEERQLRKKKSDYQKNLIALQVRNYEMGDECSKYKFFTADYKKMKHLESCRQIIVANTMSNWKKKISTQQRDQKSQIKITSKEL